ncbi:bacteriocin immunity protein [Streptococcus sp. zg-JUN1979]|uniref:bacteriocin immunity protein n=1 Tax=Streptococcus sp. zg-JUN1979 TaxID=3391450 RepID=UPI0039A67C03
MSYTPQHSYQDYRIAITKLSYNTKLTQREQDLFKKADRAIARGTETQKLLLNLKDQLAILALQEELSSPVLDFYAKLVRLHR